MHRGDAKIQFFTNYNYIKSLYYERGFVVAKHLYNLLQKEEKISISYKQFNRYFQEFIFSKDERFSKVSKEINKPLIIKEPPKVKKIVVGDNNKKKNFNPHTTKISPENIL